MSSNPTKDDRPALHNADRMEHPENSTEVTAAPPQGAPWTRISLRRSFIYLMIPVVTLSLISGALAAGIKWSAPAHVETFRFWFYFFDVGRELNVPTWFSSGLWIAAGILAGYFARHASRYRRSWALFAVVCLVLSIDETLELHERLDGIGNALAKYVPVQLGFTWVIPGLLIAGLIVLSLLRMVLSLPRTPRTALLAAGIIFVGGGVGVETLSGFFIQGVTLPWQFFLLTLIEETLEMTGIALLVAALAHIIAVRPSADRSTAYRVADGSLPEPEPAAGPPH